MVLDVQLAKMKEVQGCLQQKVLPGPPEHKPPHPNSPGEETDARSLAAQARSKSGLFESRVLSFAWHSLGQVWASQQGGAGQRHGSLQSGCLSARVRGTHLWLIPHLQHSSFQALCHRIFPSETPLFLYRTAPAALTSFHF